MFDKLCIDVNVIKLLVKSPYNTNACYLIHIILFCNVVILLNAMVSSTEILILKHKWNVKATNLCIVNYFYSKQFT